jgi:hypothetical protein
MNMEILFLHLDFARHGISPFDRFTHRWESPDEPVAIGLALKVGSGRLAPVRGCGRKSEAL